MTTPVWKWFIEYTHPTQAHMHGVSKYVFSGETDFQTVEIIDTEFFGRCLVLDGKIQSSEFDEYIYHETLIHPAMCLLHSPRKVMVVGGGEGAVLREILRHPTVEQVVMVDIDKEVVELCQEYLPDWHQGAFSDPRVKLLHLDARKYLEESDETFDIIFMDLTEPVDDGPSYLLFTKEFYETVSSRLAPEGMIALQAGSFNPRLLDCHGAIYNTLSLVFPVVRSYSAFIPSYDSAWGFALASKSKDPLLAETAELDELLKQREIGGLRFYDGQTHRGMFALSKDIRNTREKEERIIEDEHPLFIF